MQSKLCTNINDLEMYLRVFQENMEQRETIETFFGLQLVSRGYQIRTINLGEGFATIEVYMQDRKIRSGDDCVRGGDLVYFRVSKGKVYTDKEWEDYVDMLEKQYEQLDNDSANKEPIVENGKTLEDDDEFLM